MFHSVGDGARLPKQDLFIPHPHLDHDFNNLSVS